MMSKGMLSVVVVSAMLAMGAGCKSEEVAKTDPPPPPPAEPTSIGATPTSTSEVASYPNQIAQGGTVMTTQVVKVYQAADPGSTLLTSLGPGTLVETKSRYGDWTLINWPSGVGKLSPGWVQAVYLGPPKVVVADAGVDSGTTPADAGVKDAGVQIPPPVIPDASAPPPAATDAGTKRPIIRLPTKKP